ncbi:AMP-binding protein [Seonamhaeicola maritimus]|uniref:AMP-binding protein n=1 Tax=Seonamhaeicola maritimus TaxID=2591822 RepID=A0A5C7GDW6_9FLAO|nr:AMP-binding protein [Seonamhaeicola maritimus]TXG34510.1 AMP-binding protein [Seonamhaeicola maritimus]
MLKFNSPLEAFLHWESNAPSLVFLNQPIANKTISFTYKEAGEEARRMASALKAYNLVEGDHVAILSKNCAHWVLADLAIMMCGFVSIPIYPTLNANSINRILEHSESKAIIVGKLDNFDTQKEGVQDIPIISVNLYGESGGDLWENLVEENEPLQVLNRQIPEALHTIIYTSGTTGTPKGVMHTVSNFMESSHILPPIFNLPQHLRVFSYLPLAHVAERVMINAGMSLGGTIFFIHSIDTFASELEKTQPHAFFAVPRIWTKFREKILESLPQSKLNVLLKIPLINKLLKNKLKKKLGLRDAHIVCSAAAPIAPSLIEWFQSLDIRIMQGYGMTEDCCVSHFNTPIDNRIGTVGKTLNNVNAKLSAEGEICIKNNCLMKGYYKAPDLTAEVFDDEGYLKTGDIGEFDHDGFLSITGRVKDQFKTDKGKYISPSYMELIISKNTDIEQVCVVGSGIPQPIVLITLSELGKAKQKDKLIESLKETVAQMNPTLENHEKIEKIIIMKEEWSVDNGLLTPTLKVKRNSIEKIHKAFYIEWFKMNNTVIFE